MTEALWNETAVPGTLTEAEVADLHKRQFSEQVEGLGFEKRRGSAWMQFRGLGIAVEETA